MNESSEVPPAVLAIAAARVQECLPPSTWAGLGEGLFEALRESLGELHRRRVIQINPLSEWQQQGAACPAGR